jgi:DNA (cytosine-5)-methyltransferase 1
VKHREFYEELKKELCSSGYALSDRLTNALEFGAPQDRDRILLVGIKKKLLNISVDTLLDFPWERHMLYHMADLRKLSWPTQDPYLEGSTLACPDAIPKELTVEYWFQKNDVTNHPDADRYFTPKAGLVRMQTIEEGDSNKKSYKRIHRWRYSPTVCYGNNEVHLHPYQSRRLSVAEAMALQSLPKEFCLPPNITLSACFKTIGNGVPLMLAQGVAKTLLEYLQENS